MINLVEESILEWILYMFEGIALNLCLSCEIEYDYTNDSCEFVI